MKEKLATFNNSVKTKWNKFNKKQKRWLFVGVGALVIILVLAIGLASYKHYVPLYSNLSPAETGQIKQTLEAKGVPFQLSDGGTTISVPDQQVDSLKVELAAEGLPKTGQIDYSFFGQNTQFGMTDKQFDVLERAAVQTELSNLITGISGVESAEVMLNLPKDSVWVTDEKQESSASIVLRLAPGYKLEPSQVQGLYHLVSKSVPNLPEDNIVIMDQYFNDYDQVSAKKIDSTLTTYQQQQAIKEDIQQNIRRQVQQMLGMMMGNDKVMVNVTTDVDFTKEKSQHDIVEPVDPETMQGLKVSTENITETYKGAGAGGKAGTADGQIPEYDAGANGEGDYQHIEERVNYVFNHIHKEIENSPYKITDLGIQVMVEPPDPDDPDSLPENSINDIKQILNTIVATTLDEDGKELSPEDIAQKSVVSVEKFNGKVELPSLPKSHTPYWIYGVLGGLALFIIILLWLLLRKKGRKTEDLAYAEEAAASKQAEPASIADQQELSPTDQRKQQLEGLAKDNPEEFVKLLRSWISDD